MNRKILAIDDSEDARNLLNVVLGSIYEVHFEENGEDGLRKALGLKPDLIILDLGLPEMDGYELCDRFRSLPDLENVPIIILSGKKGTEAHAKAYRLGADNYLEKPFEREELLALVESKLKFNTSKLRKTIGRLTVDLKTSSAYIEGEKVDLTPKEFKILAVMWENIDEVTSREAIFRSVWEKTHVSDRVIDNHVTSLRKKITSSGLRVESIYSEGYKLVSK